MAKSISRYLADISSTSGVLDGTLSTAAQTNITSLGTLSSLTVSGSAAMTLTTAAQPNITSVGTLSTLAMGGSITRTGDLLLDASGKIILDADDPHIQLKDGNLLFGSIYAFGSDLHIKSEIQDEDIIFQGNDGGSAINALILDMSDAGKATFNSGIVSTGALIRAASSGATADASADELVVENSANAGISILSGATSTGSIYFGDSGTNWDGYIAYSQSDRKMTLGTAAGGRVYIDSAGKVGIGSTSPAAIKFSGSATGVLQVKGTMPVIAVTESDVSDAEIFMGITGGTGYIGKAGAGSLYLQTGATTTVNRMIIDNDGDVAIGSVAPAKGLHISKDTGVTHNGIRIDNTTSYYGQLEFFTTGGSRRNFVQSSGAAHLELGSDSSTNGEIHFYTNGAIRAKIAAAGTTTFEHPIVLPNGATSGLYIEQTGGTATPRFTNDGNNWTIIRPGASGADVAFNNYANTANLFTITDEGNVGLNENTPTSYYSKTFQINGSGNTSAIKLTNTATGNANNRGHDIASDGADMRLANREANGHWQVYTTAVTDSPLLAIDVTEDQQVRMPKQATFEASGSGGWSGFLGAGAWHMTIDTERHDANADFDNTNGKFTAPHDGYYIFTASWYFQKNTSTAANTYLHPGFFINNSYSWMGGNVPYTIFGNAISNHSVSGYPEGVTITRTIYMASGDYVEAKIYVSTDNTWRHYANYSYFAGGYLGG